jgi:hypothetical protein
MVPAVVELTVAVNVTDCPTFDGFGDAPKDAVVTAFVEAFTVCVSAADVLAVKFESPPYTAVIDCDPRVSEDVANVA